MLQFERYELLGEIARGGIGVVYRARDKATGEICALKCVNVGERPHAKEILEGFEREYQVLRGLSHPRIIRVFDYGVIEEGAFYTMELLEGRDLRKSAPLPWRETCQVLRDIATCLSLLHARRLIHRDLSPGNVKLTADGHCKLIDFGALVEFGQTDTVIGTAPFVAPEVLNFGRLDQRVDLYALGALGYHCLTGHHAYPAERMDDLPEVWKRAPAPPSQLTPEVPAALDELIMSLLRENALARPVSAAEVIARLDAIAHLEAEDEAAQRVLAQSFLAAPRYVGRKLELARFDAALAAVSAGDGKAVRVAAPAGAGRTRFLEEAAIRAQLEGALVVRADASAQRGRQGVMKALAHSLLNTAPQLARECGKKLRPALAAVDPALEARVLDQAPAPVLFRHSGYPRTSSVPPPSMRPSQRPKAGRKLPHVESTSSHGIEQWFVEVSREHALVVLVDNVECADDVSLASLIALAREARHEHILLVFTEQTDAHESEAFGLGRLRADCETMTLDPLSRAETVELMRSLFGEAPRAERLADWLHAQTAGSPLHCMGVIGHWLAQGVIRHERGSWVLPSSKPDTQVSEALEDALIRRLDELSPQARELAQSLSLQRLDTTFELCRRLVDAKAQRSVLALLEELSAGDVLHRDQDRFFFSSAALRQAVLRRMTAPARRVAHLRLGRALLEVAGDDQLALRIEAGWHLIRGGDEMRGADVIAEVTQDSLACNVLVANLYHIGAPVEAALKVYRSARKSKRARMPLLTALAQAGFYEHYRWAEAYGDDALDVVEELSGLNLARRLRRFLGGHLALALGVGIACIRHYLSPPNVRGGSFLNLLIHLCSTVTALSAVAAICLDPERCDRVAELLSPGAVLPKRVALAGIYRFCQGLQQIAREHQTEAFGRFDELVARFADPDYFWLLPPEGRIVYTTACHFARGAFAMMRADGAATLESAEQLERSGLPLYLMIASQLRYLYHLNRGELTQALIHRERVEMHAARVGSAWQVELWEPASLLPYYIATDDVVELTRIAVRVSELVEAVPSMWRYRELAQMASEIHTRKPDLVAQFWQVLHEPAPRSFIGWSTALAGAASYFNQLGEHGEAMKLLAPALKEITDADRQYVMIFLLADMQAALAEAGLGSTDQALSRLEHLLALHTPSGHTLTLGLVHEMRARIAFAAGKQDLYEESTREATRWLRPTGTPALVARCDRLEQLGAATPSGMRSDLVAVTGFMVTGVASNSNTRVAKRPAAS